MQDNDKEVQNNVVKEINFPRCPTKEDLKSVIGTSLEGTVCNGQRNVKSVKWKNFSLNPFVNLLTLLILSTLLWTIIWCSWGPNWAWDGVWFRLISVGFLSWLAGYILNSVTNLPPVVAALAVGVLTRNLGYFDIREYEEIDSFLRKIYPVVILGKASLGWDIHYMRSHWKRILPLGTLPWMTEALVLTACTTHFLDFPLIWGLLLGSIYASLSCAVVMPSVIQLNGLNESKRNWTQLVCTSKGIDTTLSVGVYGLIHGYLFYSTVEPYRITKATLTIFVGVALGISWGTIAKYLPNKNDTYVAELRFLFLLLGGLACNFLTLFLGWSGTAGVAVLTCNATAAHHWKALGWPLNKHPVATAYRVLCGAVEPLLFAFTSNYLVFNSETMKTTSVGFGILAICLCTRWMVTILICWDFGVKEKLLICCTAIPKTIVEAVLSPAALTALHALGEHRRDEIRYAEDMLRLIIQAIIITTPMGYLLTHYIGPKLITSQNRSNKKEKDDLKRKSKEEFSA